MPTLLLAINAVVLYLAAAAALALPLLDRPSLPRQVGLGLAALGVLTHALLAFGDHAGGLNLHFFSALSVVALLVAALTLLVNLLRPVAGLGVIVFPLAALFLSADTLSASPPPAALEWQIKLHALLALFAFAVLSIAAVLAILLAGC